MDDRDDWGRREIAEAFRHGVRVIPLLLNADLPAADLPDEIGKLVICQFVRIQHRSADQDIRRLTAELLELVPDLSVAGTDCERRYIDRVRKTSSTFELFQVGAGRAPVGCPLDRFYARSCWSPGTSPSSGSTGP